VDVFSEGGFMNNIFFGLITLAILVLAGFVVYAVLALKKTLDSVKKFIETTENSLVPAVEEIQLTLRSVRKITDDTGAVTEDVKVLSASVREMGDSVKRINSVVNTALCASTSQVAGLKAGLKAGLVYFLKNMLSKDGPY
jgi:uncharacterized protein YoxC